MHTAKQIFKSDILKKPTGARPTGFYSPYCLCVCAQADGEDGRLFQWHDGPLVLAMKEGGVFLMDEISLADDSVLERLNRLTHISVFFFIFVLFFVT